MQDDTKVKELSETGEIEIYDIEEEDASKGDPLIEELGELNDTEKAILERMRGALKEPFPAAQARVSLDGSPATEWAAITVGQNVAVSGLQFKISHISQGYVVLEADESPKSGPKPPEAEPPTWTQLQCTGARALIRIDGTPFFVETRILTGVIEEEKDGEEQS